MTDRFKFIIKEFRNNLIVFKQLLVGAEEIALWKPSPQQWCLLEIVCHLYDEEREDFRAQIDHIFMYPGLPPTPINPQGWVKGRKYRQQNYTQCLSHFLSEREKSLTWLRDKMSTDIPASWDCVIQDSRLGEISAQSFLENWLGHDYLHIQQILKLKLTYLSHFTENPLDYARG